MPEPETTRLPHSWRPQVGDVLAGFIVERHERPSDYSDEDVTVLVVDQLDTAVSVWCSTKQLRGLVSDFNPEPGDFLEIRYDGQEWVKFVNNYRKVYTCRVTKAT